MAKGDAVPKLHLEGFPEDVLRRLRAAGYNVDKPANDGADALFGAKVALEAVGHWRRP